MDLGTASEAGAHKRTISLDSKVVAAIAAAITFLLAARDSKGWWRDFDTLAGPSDEWVTAYVGSALASVPWASDERASLAAREAWNLLRRRRWWSEGWGYNARVPADADSTAWALLLADGIDERRSFRLRRARSFLSKHLRPEGGLATYAKDGPIRYFTRLQRHISFSGWCGTHTCVTALAATLGTPPLHAHLLNYLRATQASDGGWKGYWWCDDAYTTALAAEALASSVQPDDQGRVQAAVRWACRQVSDKNYASMIQPGSSAFADAWHLRTLMLASADERRRAQEAIHFLLERLLKGQRQSGSWTPSARLRIPPPDVRDPEEYRSWNHNGRGGGSIVLDHQALFTTATVLKALQMLLHGRPGR